mgnify:CR=1 FL=1
MCLVRIRQFKTFWQSLSIGKHSVVADTLLGKVVKPGGVRINDNLYTYPTGQATPVTPSFGVLLLALPIQ